MPASCESLEGLAGRRSVRVGIEMAPFVFLSAATPARIVPAKSALPSGRLDRQRCVCLSPKAFTEYLTKGLCRCLTASAFELLFRGQRAAQLLDSAANFDECVVGERVLTLVELECVQRFEQRGERLRITVFRKVAREGGSPTELGKQEIEDPVVAKTNPGQYRRHALQHLVVGARGRAERRFNYGRANFGQR